MGNNYVLIAKNVIGVRGFFRAFKFKVDIINMTIFASKLKTNKSREINMI